MLQFVREIPIRIVLQGTPSSRRGFLFHMAAGFSPQSGHIDPLSGMSVNLVHVDSWLAEVKAQAELSPCANLNDMLQEFRVRLSDKALLQGASLSSLVLREERGWSLSWNSSDPARGVRWTYSHYLELLPLAGSFELVRVDLTWLRPSSCDTDLQYEGFKIMKSLQSTSGLPQLLEVLRPFKGMSLETGCVLQEVRVRLSSQYIFLTL